MMRDPVTGEPHTAHTTNPVPVIADRREQPAPLAEGRLADIAPTLLELMDLPKPTEMTGASLLRGMTARAARRCIRARLPTRSKSLRPSTSIIE